MSNDKARKAPPFPIDYSEWGSTLLSWAEGNRITSLADYLKKRGAKH